MRVIAGSNRGRRLTAPDGLTTRPTSDRVKEAMFNALQSLDVLHDARVVDLYAGSGALGIEALSRGVSWVDFVESDRDAVAAIDANVHALDLGGASAVHRRQVDAWEGPAQEPDLVLADPPYSFEDWSALLDRIGGWMPSGLVVVESGAAIDLPSRWDRVREKVYGGTVVTFARVAARSS